MLAAKIGLSSDMALRVVGSLFTAALLGLFGLVTARRAAAHGQGWTSALVMCLPMLASLYVLQPGAWIQPDNAAWLGVLVLLVITWRMCEMGRFGLWSLAACAGVLTCLVLVRQIHIWGAALVWTACWIGAADIKSIEIEELFSNIRRRIGRLVVGILITLPAAAALYGLWRIWGGLTPPNFQDQHAAGMNLATPALVLSLLAIYSVFFGAWLWPLAVRAWNERPLFLMGAATVGFVLAVVPQTTYLQEQRSSGLWNVVRTLESYGVIVMGRTSPLIVVLSMAGAVCAAAWVHGLAPGRAWMARVLFLAFVAAQTANSNAWQRYLEPMLLMLVALAAAGAAPMRLHPALRLAGPVVLGVLLGLVTLNGVTRTEVFATPTNPRLVAPLPNNARPAIPRP